MRSWQIFLFGSIFFQGGLFSVMAGSVSNQRGITFFKIAFPGPHAISQTLLDQSPPRPNHSASQCGIICRTAPPDGESRVCVGFLYSFSTGLCQVCYRWYFFEELYRHGYGDAYMGCDHARGYILHYRTNGDVVCKPATWNNR